MPTWPSGIVLALPRTWLGLLASVSWKVDQIGDVQGQPSSLRCLSNDLAEHRVEASDSSSGKAQFVLHESVEGLDRFGSDPV